jgi:hypothetical protein
MHTSRHFSWKQRSLGAVALGVAVAAMAAPAALGDGRSPDTLDAAYAVNSTATQDGWYQGAVQQNFAITDGRSPDTIDAALSIGGSVGRYSTAPQGVTAAAYRALMLRGEALNEKYHLGRYSTASQGMTAAAYRALMVRGEALNEKYHGIGLQDGWYQSALEQSSVISDGRSPDTLNAVSAAQAASLDLRSPDTLDAVYAVSQGPVVADGRSPDTRDAAYVARQPSGVAGQPGFVWGDAAIGFAVAVGLALLGMAMYLAFRRHQKPGVSMPHVPA